ncbi:hypothetical protein NJ76_19180, partial [Rhodococcus sp. IITR03]
TCRLGVGGQVQFAAAVGVGELGEQLHLRRRSGARRQVHVDSGIGHTASVERGAGGTSAAVRPCGL